MRWAHRDRTSSNGLFPPPPTLEERKVGQRDSSDFYEGCKSAVTQSMGEENREKLERKGLVPSFGIKRHSNKMSFTCKLSYRG